MITPAYYLALSALLFGLGLLGVLRRRHALAALLGVQLMWLAGELALVVFARAQGSVHGQVLALFAAAAAALQAVMGLALLTLFRRRRHSLDLGEANQLKW